jgi:hypothetical protein
MHLEGKLEETRKEQESKKAVSGGPLLLQAGSNETIRMGSQEGS